MPDHTAPLGAGHDTYATSTRADILPLVDRRYPHVLDVGCSAGNTGALLKERGLCERVTGIEPFAATAALARAGPVVARARTGRAQRGTPLPGRAAAGSLGGARPGGPGRRPSLKGVRS